MEENQQSVENTEEIAHPDDLRPVPCQQQEPTEQAPTNEGQNLSEKENIPPQNAEQERQFSLLQEENQLLKKREEEVKEFLRFYPTINPYTLPSEVKILQAQGNTLACSYAFYLLQKSEREKEAQAKNQQNNASSLGCFGMRESSFITEEEAKRMTRDEVRKNFETILASMKNWN